jgi:hypothetical protein
MQRIHSTVNVATLEADIGLHETGTIRALHKTLEIFVPISLTTTLDPLLSIAHPLSFLKESNFWISRIAVFCSVSLSVLAERKRLSIMIQKCPRILRSFSPFLPFSKQRKFMETFISLLFAREVACLPNCWIHCLSLPP